jgi:RNA polymerase sigma factor (sigma-70 family)
MEQIQSGSETAVQTLLGQYGDHLYRAVRRRLSRALRRKFDTSDFVQAVWASFFCDHDKLRKFEHSSQLVAFLTRVAQNKVVDESRRRRTKKSDVTRETSMSPDPDQEEIEVPGREPTPSQVAIGQEEFERMMGDMPSQYRPILRLRALGETQEEIASKLGLNERTVRRMLKKVRDRRERRK